MKEDRTRLYMATGEKLRTPDTREATVAAMEAEALVDLITAASENPQAVMNENSIPTAGYMLCDRLATMRAFIEAKGKEEGGMHDAGGLKLAGKA